MLQMKATSYLNAVLDQEGPAQTSWCSKWAVHGKASRPALKHHRVACRRKDITGQQRLLATMGQPGRVCRLRQQRARPDIAPVDPSQEPSLTM
jgi:hypothetical protein